MQSIFLSSDFRQYIGKHNFKGQRNYKSFLVFRYFLFGFDILSFMYREVLVLAQCERAPLEYRFCEAETAFIFLQKDSCAKMFCGYYW